MDVNVFPCHLMTHQRVVTHHSQVSKEETPLYLKLTDSKRIKLTADLLLLSAQGAEYSTAATETHLAQRN